MRFSMWPSLPAELKPLVDGFEATDDHVVITDAKGCIVYANSAAEKHTGYTRLEMIGVKPGHLWGGRMPKDFYAHMWDTIKTHQQCFVGDFQNCRKGGELYWQEVHVIPIVGQDGAVRNFIGIELDVDDNQKRQAILERTRLPKHIASKVQVQWPLEWLFDADHLSDVQLADLQKQFGKGAALDSLTDDLIMLSHIKFSAREKCETFSITELLEELVKEISAQYPDRHYAVAKPQKPLKVEQSRELLVQVLKRIILNAAQYSSPGKGQVRISVIASGTSCTVKCEDNGIGMTVQDQLRLYHKFFRGMLARKVNPAGVGLSLFMAKTIADTMQWQLSCTSLDRVGTSFRLVFPMRQPSK